MYVCMYLSIYLSIYLSTFIYIKVVVGPPLEYNLLKRKCDWNLLILYLIPFDEKQNRNKQKLIDR